MTAPSPFPTDERLPVLIDFDGTLAEGTWPLPQLGAPIPQGLMLLHKYALDGHAIKIFTARPASHKEAIWNWLRQNGVGPLIYDVITDKPPSSLYIDDRSWNPLEHFAETRPGVVSARIVDDEDPEDEPMDPADWTVIEG